MITDRELCKHFGHLEDHQYKHFNNALGCYVNGKEHFRILLDKGGFVPYESAVRAVESAEKHKRKDYTLSPEAQSFISSIRQTADSKGRVKLGSLAIDAMKRLGVSFGDVRTDLDAQKGGFCK